MGRRAGLWAVVGLCWAVGAGAEPRCCVPGRAPGEATESCEGRWAALAAMACGRARLRQDGFRLGDDLLPEGPVYIQLHCPCPKAAKTPENPHGFKVSGCEYNEEHKMNKVEDAPTGWEVEETLGKVKSLDRCTDKNGLVLPVRLGQELECRCNYRNKKLGRDVEGWTSKIVGGALRSCRDNGFGPPVDFCWEEAGGRLEARAHPRHFRWDAPRSPPLWFYEPAACLADVRRLNGEREPARRLVSPARLCCSDPRRRCRARLHVQGVTGGCARCREVLGEDFLEEVRGGFRFFYKKARVECDCGLGAEEAGWGSADVRHADLTPALLRAVKAPLGRAAACSLGREYIRPRRRGDAEETLWWAAQEAEACGELGRRPDPFLLLGPSPRPCSSPVSASRLPGEVLAQRLSCYAGVSEAPPTGLRLKSNFSQLKARLVFATTYDVVSCEEPGSSEFCWREDESGDGLQLTERKASKRVDQGSVLYSKPCEKCLESKCVAGKETCTVGGTRRWAAPQLTEYSEVEGPRVSPAMARALANSRFALRLAVASTLTFLLILALVGSLLWLDWRASWQRHREALADGQGDSDSEDLSHISQDALRSSDIAPDDTSEDASELITASPDSFPRH